MSTASPLPLQHLPSSTVSEAETRALKQQVTHRLREHRQRRAQYGEQQPVLPMDGLALAPRNSHVADSVAARFAKSLSYREFLQQEAETAVAQAAATAEVARRNANAVASVQQELLAEMEQWSAPGPHPSVQIAEAASQGEQETGAFGAANDGATAEGGACSSGPVMEMEEASLFEVRVSEQLHTQAGPVEPAVSIPANLIEFPRQLVAARRARPRLAEGPLREEADAAPERAQLRIFEVEASAVSTTPAVERILPDWHDIRLDDTAEAQFALGSADAQASLALPVYVAPVALRAMAAIVDGCCVVTALLLAVVIASYASPVLPTGVYAILSAGGALFVFALLYLLLFSTLDDATPGMRYARIGFCTFADENPSRASIRRRTFALLLAALPLGLGLVWACMDEDGLGWHDRISRMYPRAY